MVRGQEGRSSVNRTANEGPGHWYARYPRTLAFPFLGSHERCFRSRYPWLVHCHLYIFMSKVIFVVFLVMLCYWQTLLLVDGLVPTLLWKRFEIRIGPGLSQIGTPPGNKQQTLFVLLHSFPLLDSRSQRRLRLLFFSFLTFTFCTLCEAGTFIWQCSPVQHPHLVAARSQVMRCGAQVSSTGTSECATPPTNLGGRKGPQR